MNNIIFTPASEKKIYLKMTLQGISGGGKTYTALAIAEGLGSKVTGQLPKIAVLDTERGASALYYKKVPFDMIELTDHSYNNYIQIIDAADKQGYDTLIIDSFSHSWMGDGGFLQVADKLAAASMGKSTFNVWSKVDPLIIKLIDKIQSVDMHVILTFRQNKEYLIDVDERGKKRIQVVGTKAIHKKDLEYDFHINAEMSVDHSLIILKSRLLDITEDVFYNPGKELGEKMYKALSGTIIDLPTKEEVLISPAQEKNSTLDTVKEIISAAKEEHKQYITKEQRTSLWKQAQDFGHDAVSAKNILEDEGISSFTEIPADKYDHILALFLDPQKFDGLK